MTLSKPNPKLANTAAYYFSILILGLFSALSGPALPTLAANTGSTLDQISLFFMLGGLGYLLGSFFGGRAYDRLPGHRLIAATLVIISLCSVFVPVVQLLWLLLAIQLINGFSQGANDVGCNTLLLWTHGKQAGPFLNGLHFCFGVGAMISPLVLAALLEKTGSIQWAYWIFAALGLPLAIWLWRMPEPAPQEEEQTVKAKGRNPVILVAVMAFAFIMYVGGEVSFGNWLYTYALTLGLSTEVTAAYLTSAFWGTFTAGRLLAVWVSTRVRPAIIVYADLLGCIASLAVIAIWPESRTALWAGSISFGLFTASVFPTMLVLAGEQMKMTGTVTGWFLVGGGLGSMLLPWVTGLAFAAIGASTMPWLVLATLVLNLFAIVLFNARASADDKAAA